MFGKNLQVKLSNRHLEEGLSLWSLNNWYTDDSRIEWIDGAGIFVEILRTKNLLNLETNAIVFQPEITAILYCCRAREIQRQSVKDQIIDIYSDKDTQSNFS